MKKLLIIILSLVLSTCIICGCTQTTTGGSQEGGTTDTGTNEPDTDVGEDDGGDGQTEDSYTVTLMFPSSAVVLPSLTGIYAIWSNDSSVYSAEFNSSGVAYCNDLDGEYRVTLSETPEGYTYNPNIYEADGGESGRNVSIYMYELSTFDGGSGASPNQGLRAAASMGITSTFEIYRIQFNASNTEFYFTFTPSYSGAYSMETYASTYENNVNPSIKKYPNIAYWGTNVLTTSGGESGTYTKNARYEFTVSDSQLSSGGLLFSVSIESATSDYPKYVDVAITWEDKYTDEDMYAQYGGAYQDVEVPEISTDWITPDGAYTMLRTTSLMNGDFTSSVTIEGTKYSQVYLCSDGFYYYCKDPQAYYAATGGKLDESGDDFATYWTLLFVQIKATELFTVSGSSILGLLQPKEFGYMYRVSVTVNGKIKNLNYNNMLTAYQAAANGDSAYPVTEELKECITNISIANTYFYDGNGWLEGWPFYYSATEEDQWLYACGVYI